MNHQPQPMAIDLPGEIWRSIEGASKYDVSNLGRVRSHWRMPGPRIMIGNLDKDGYRKICLRYDNGVVATPRRATLVATAFLGARPNGKTVAHGNGLPTDDRAANLSYKTQLENIHDKFSHGTILFGESNPKSKLTVDLARFVFQSPRTAPDLATEIGVAATTVWAVRKRKTWKHATADL